jgi:hypothetical protein
MINFGEISAMEELIVTKAGGEQVVFSADKLRTSMRNAGAPDDIIDAVMEELLPKLYNGISTRKIYRWAFDMLKNRSRNLASKYKLKHAIMELGPDGFIFERFVSEILRQSGYQTKIGVIVQGKCISHEIDVLATSKSEHILVECKYHSQPGKVSDVKVPLYIRSRFEDVRSQWMIYPEIQNKKISCKVITNTRFSPDAATYARCEGLELIGWDYPYGNGIKEMIDEMRLYPLTCLTSLSKGEKESLMAQGVLFCKDLTSEDKITSIIHISANRIKTILEEAAKLS